MAGKRTIITTLVISLLIMVPACSNEKPPELKKPEETVIIKPKPPLLSAEQRAELGFPPDLITNIELAAGAQAEPFHVTVLVPSENLKGEKGFEAEHLAGFSVRTKNADELISSYHSGLRVRGYLIFKSQLGYGSLPDTVSVAKGNSSYDILKLQGTEASGYNIDTDAIISWLKQQQQIASFFVSGAGPDWVEARFTRKPVDLRVLAKKIYAFAPDVRQNGHASPEKLAELMKKENGFYLVWD